MIQADELISDLLISPPGVPGLSMEMTHDPGIQGFKEKRDFEHLTSLC